MMKLFDWNLQTRLFAISAIPFICVCLFLSAYHTHEQNKKFDSKIDKRGAEVIQQLIPFAQHALTTGNYKNLQEILNRLISNRHYRSFNFFDSDKLLIAFQGDYQSDQVPTIVSASERSINKKELETHAIAYTAGVYGNEINSTNNHLTHKLLGYVDVIIDTTDIELAKYHHLLTSIFLTFFSLGLGLLILFLLINYFTQPLVDASIEEATADLKHNLETLELKNAELSQKRKEALEKHRTKSEFLASMTHEIRTPLNGVIGFTELLLETDLTVPQREYLTTVKKSATNLISIINNILDYSKLEAGKLELDHIPMDIRECIEDVLTILLPEAQKKQLQLVAITHENIPMKLLGDPLRFKQILTNLVGNAIKFTESGSVRIEFELLEDRNESVCIRTKVIDTGIGLTADEQKKLFTAYQQAKPSTFRNYGGTGLGLIICEKIIHQMQGKIEIESNADNGTTFWFTFIAEKISSSSGNLIEYKRLANLRVLCYEEDEATALSYQETLKLWKMHVICIHTFQAFIKKLDSAEHFDLVIIGDKPQTPSFVSEVMDNISKFYNDPIVVLTDSTDQNTLYSYLAQGASLCSSKFISYKHLYHELCELLFESEINQTLTQISDDRFEKTSDNKINVLVVEDNAVNLLLFTALINNLNAKVVTAADGREAVIRSEQEKFDLILLDLQMPNMDGIEATQTIRQQSKLNAETPILVISAHITPEDHRALDDAGANESLIKPVDANRLQELILKWTKTEPLQLNMGITQPIPVRQSHEIINWAKCLEMAANKNDLALEILEKIVDELPHSRKMFNKLLKQKNYDTLRHEIHKLHGATCYSGLPELKTALFEIETALSKNQHTHLKKLFKPLEKAIKNILKTFESKTYLA